MDLFYRFSYEEKMNNMCYFCDVTKKGAPRRLFSFCLRQQASIG